MKLTLFLIGLFLATPARADHDTKVAKDVGSYVQTASVTGSSFTGTAFISANAKRMDGVLFNNTGSEIWIGTTTATQDMVMHSNINIGIPVLASATFSLGGVMSDALYFTCGNTVATCNVRVLEGRNR